MNNIIRDIKSFVRRNGRMTAGQQRALDTLWQRYCLEPADQLIDFSGVFSQTQPLHVEIGFGNGVALLANALQNPQNNYIGIEVHRPGVGHLFLELEAKQINNVRIFCADAAHLFKHCFADNCLAQIQILFPDPWPKKRHHKRRLIQPTFVDLLVNKLQPEGQLMLATDWEEYALHMLAVLEPHAKLSNQAGPGQFSPRPEARPITRFEQRGLKRGHKTFDLVYSKNS